MNGWRRRRLAARYDALLVDAPIARPTEMESVRHAYHLYVVRTDEPAALAEALSGAGVQARPYYRTPVHRQPGMAAFGGAELPVTEVTDEALLSFNRPEIRAVGVPGGGGIATAATVALFYQALLTGCAHDGRRVWKPETLEMARRVRSGELRDPAHGKLANRALGLIIAGADDRVFRGFGHTNSELAFGHGGAGGQIAWADPATGISIGYCMMMKSSAAL